MGSSNNCPTFVFLGSSNNWSTVSALRLDNLKQLPNSFGFVSWEVQTTAQHLWSWDASISQRYSTQIFGSSNNCLMVLDYVLGISNNWSTNSIMSHTKFNQILNLFSLQSREIKRTAQRLWIRVMGSSNNCPTHVVLRCANNWSTVSVLSLDNFKQLPNGFSLRFWKFLAIAVCFQSWVSGSSNNCPTFLVWIISNHCPMVSIVSIEIFK